MKNLVIVLLCIFAISCQERFSIQRAVETKRDPEVQKLIQKYGPPTDPTIFDIPQEARAGVEAKNAQCGKNQQCFVSNRRCCPYNWIWSVDTSRSMATVTSGMTAIGRVHFARQFFMYWVNQFWCSQFASTFGFDSDTIVYDQFVHKSPWNPSWINPFHPPVSGDPTTRYGPAITQAILIIIRYQTINHCVLFWSDGGSNVYPSAQITLYNFVKNCHRCTVCAACFFVKKYSYTPIDNIFRRTCLAMGATFYAHDDPWILAGNLRSFMTNAILYNRPHCKCPTYKWWQDKAVASTVQKQLN